MWIYVCRYVHRERENEGGEGEGGEQGEEKQFHTELGVQVHTDTSNSISTIKHEDKFQSLPFCFVALFFSSGKLDSHHYIEPFTCSFL